MPSELSETSGRQKVKVASLFRGVPPDVFNERVRDLFL